MVFLRASRAGAAGKSHSSSVKCKNSYGVKQIWQNFVTTMRSAAMQAVIVVNKYILCEREKMQSTLVILIKLLDKRRKEHFLSFLVIILFLFSKG